MKWVGIIVGAGLFFCGSLPGRAEQPRKDPLVAALRDRFKQARRPTMEDLKIGEYWNCVFRSAEPGSRMHATFPGSYYFERRADGKIHLRSDEPWQLYALGERSLNGSRYWDSKLTGRDHIRIGQHGELLSEVTLPACSGLECFFLLSRAGGIENRWELLIGYNECHLQK